MLNRSVDEGIGMKDLDTLQLELEKLLSASAVRSRLLTSELEGLDRVEDRHDTKKGKLFEKVLHSIYLTILHILKKYCPSRLHQNTEKWKKKSN